MKLATGAEARFSGRPGRLAVVCMNGGRKGELPGSWSASLEWLVGRLAPRFPDLLFAELRYRVRSWQRLAWCMEDARALIAATGAERTLLIGYSMGGAVAIGVAGERSVATVVGLAPWLPERLSLEGLRGRRLRVVHGRLDRALPGIPGVSPRRSRLGVERARELGIECDYSLLAGGLHGIAVRLPGGRLLPLPRAGRWADLVAHELARFRSG